MEKRINKHFSLVFLRIVFNHVLYMLYVIVYISVSELMEVVFWYLGEYVFLPFWKLKL